MRCPDCGNENREGAKFCDSCGADLTEVAAPESAAPPESPAPAESAAPPESPPAPESAPTPQPAVQEKMPADAPERVAERYTIRSFLGRGGRKDVYLADDAERDREVAVAMFSTEGLGEALLARARREMQAMEKLGDHPHVVTVFDTGEENGRPYIVSRYMPGGDVQRLLAASEASRLEVPRAIGIAIDVCRALEHAHSRGIVHRDLKPANVWLAEDGTARLGDFGLAATGEGRTSSAGALVGTVAYLPPEQALGRPSGPRSDLYSLGALLYEMVAGQPPFAGDDAVSIVGQHLSAVPVAPSRHNPAVPPALDKVILNLLAKSASDRPQSAAAAREELEAVRDAPAEAAPADGEEENPLEGLAGRVFVGRETELSELRSAADEALGGRGRLVLMAGEPGIGKTRTAEELATYAQMRGAKVHWGRCHEGEGAPAYWPWMQAIRSYVREADPVALAWEMGAGAADIARVVPEVAEQIGEVPEPPSDDDDAARFRLFDSVSTFLSGAASSRPMVIVVDDLHWADEPSLLLLQFLARAVGDAGLLLIGTYRDVELGRHHPLSRVLGELSGAERASRVVLRGLDEDAVGRYIQMTAGKQASEGLVSAVHDQTEGNPFFLGEVVRLLASEGALDNGGAGSLAIPQGVRDVVGRRLDRLDEEANKLLTVGAAIGRDFEAEVLTKVAEVDAEQVDEALRKAVAAQLLSEPAPGRFRFSHALVRETLYEELSATKRPAMHKRIGEVLEETYAAQPGRLERRLAEVANHFLEGAPAGEAERAVDFAVRAAEQATSQLGHEEAAEHYERALEVLDLCEPDAERRCRLLVALGEAQTKAGQFVDARETLVRSADAAQELGSSELLARAAIGIGTVAEVGSLDERLVTLLEAALEAIEPGDSPTRVRLLSFLAQEYYWVDPQGRSRELGDEAVEMARRVGDDATLAFVLGRGQFVDITPEATQQSIDDCDEMHELAKRGGDRELEMRAHVLRLRSYLALGNIRAVDRDLEAYARLAEELRQPQHLWHIPLLRGMRAIIDGRFEEAERLGEEARLGGERAQEPLAQQFFAIQTSLRFRLQGRLEEIIGPVESLAARYPAILAWRTAQAVMYTELGRTDEARSEFERLAANDFNDIAVDATWLPAIATLAEVAYALEDAPRVERLRGMLEPWRGQTVVVGRAAVCWGPVSRFLGLLSAAAGDLDRAVEELEESVEMSQRMGDRPFRAQARLNLASVLLKRDASGDRELALELLDRCLNTSQELGMRAITDGALALKLETQGLAGVDITTSIDEVIAAVEDERPDIRAHAAPDGTVTILFSDIEDSTVMTERLGDERWLELLRSHNSVFRDRLSAHDGYEVKNQGDGFMLVFPSPTGALRCAIEVQKSFAERASESPEEAIRVRMGLHTGEAIAEEGDFFGRNVILAARIAAKARGGEILVSSDLREQADGEDGLSFDAGRELELKGMAGTHTVYRADWQPEPAAA